MHCAPQASAATALETKAEDSVLGYRWPVRQLVQDLRSGKIEVLELPDPSPGPRDVLVRTRCSVISAGTELAVSSTASRSLIGKARERPEQARQVIDKALRDGIGPTIAAVNARLDDLLTPGYSSMGVVEAVGSSVGSVRVGDRVGCVGAGAACHAELAIVPAPLCIKLPDELDDEWGAFGAIGGIAGHGVRVAEVTAGSVVAVIGVGLVGQLAAQFVTAAGARAIVMDPVAERVALAQSLGAVAGGVIGTDDLPALVEETTSGYGADAVVITAATKDSAPLRLAATVARDRAVIVAVGDVGLDVPRPPFYEKELQLRVSRSYGPGRYDSAYEQEGQDYPIGYVRWTERRLISYFFEEVAAGRIGLRELVTHDFPIERGEEAYAALSEPSRLAILLRYPAAPRPAVTRATLGAEAGQRPPAGHEVDSLRLGLIGPGLFARSTLLPKLKKHGDQATIVAVAGRSTARAFGVARRFGARVAARDPEQLFGDDSIDAVIIATQHDSHAPLTVRALEAGKAVFVEKPLAIDEAGLGRVEDLLATGGRLTVDFNRSLAPATRRVAAHFAGRTEPIHIDCRINAGYLPPDHWLRDPARGGGRLVGEGCHFVDLCSCLVGKTLESVQVDALGTGPRTLVGDNFSVTLRYVDGSLATIRYISTGDTRMSKERIEVLGADRSAVIDDFRRTQLYARRRRSGDRLYRGQDKGHDAILEASIKFFRGIGPAPIPYARLSETTRATLVARQALDDRWESPIALSTR
jgi:predicted dehydrogenase/threonine dehydrogenase-like Zn-dependent dehydrogenase